MTAIAALLVPSAVLIIGVASAVRFIEWVTR